MSWKNLSEDVLAEFEHYEHGFVFLTNDGSKGDCLPLVGKSFPSDVCSPGQRWLEGDAVERAAIVASLEAIARQPSPKVVHVALEVDRRLGRPTRIKNEPKADVRRILSLYRRGVSLRGIERETGIGRNRIARIVNASCT